MYTSLNREKKNHRIFDNMNSNKIIKHQKIRQICKTLAIFCIFFSST